MTSTIPKIWLCEDETSPVKFKILEAYPKDQWDKETGVMYPPTSHAFKKHCASAKICDAFGNSFIIGFQVEVVSNQPDEFGRFKILRDPKFSMRMFRKDAENSCETITERMYASPPEIHMETEIHIGGVFYYRARAERILRMGDLVYVVKISKTSTPLKRK